MQQQVKREGFVDPLVPLESAEVVELPAEAPKSPWPITVKLSHKPIIGNRREQLTELTFREPTAADIIRCGNPVWISSTTQEIFFDERKMTTMMAQLSGVLLPLLDALHPNDWNSCAYRLRPFFLPAAEAFWGS